MDGLTDAVEGLLHAETQIGDRGIDLTAAAVYAVDAPGRIDFGGGELEPADRSPVRKRWRSADDDYQWWHLEAGTYLLEYNESLTGDRSVGLQPRDALLERGGSHPTVTVESLPTMPLAVPEGGLRLKENARVSTVRDSARGR